MWLPYRLTQLLPSRARVRKAWYSSPLFRSERELKRRWTIARGNHLQQVEHAAQPAVTLCRIIGNDLFPRQQRGQAVANLKTILQRESNPHEWKKLFILNRFIDADLQCEAVELIRQAGHTCDVIGFEPDVYRSLRYRPEIFGGLDYFVSSEFKAKDPFCQDRERIWACGEKIRYLMNINSARNHALALGRAASDWTFVLDGSCFLPRPVFEALQSDLSSSPGVPYLIVPMRRQAEACALEQVDVTPTNREEPQIAFRSDSAEQFDEAYPYGVRDKTSLLNRLGVPGAWCGWTPLPWYREPESRSMDRYRFKYASSSVLRLTSGVNNGALELPSAQMQRYRSRIQAIFSTLLMVDRKCQSPDSALLPLIADLPLELTQEADSYQL
jgi:hypothetical protein